VINAENHLVCFIGKELHSTVGYNTDNLHTSQIKIINTLLSDIEFHIELNPTEAVHMKLNKEAPKMKTKNVNVRGNVNKASSIREDPNGQSLTVPI
jgi:hypothetical protein